MAERLSPQQLQQLWRQAAASCLTEEAQVLWFGNAVMDALEGKAPTERVSLAALGLPTASYHALLRSGFQWIDQVDGMTVKELMRLYQVGLNRAIEIRQAIERWRNAG